MNGKNETDEDSKKGTKRGQTNSEPPKERIAKTHQDYWKTRLRKRSFKDRDGVASETGEWHVRIKHKLRDMWFNLQTANQASAALKARDIYVSILAVGPDATIEKFKPKADRPAVSCTVGEFLDAIGAKSHLRPRTLGIYGAKFRKLIADIACLEKGLKGAAKRAKFDHVHGGRLKWLEKINEQKLSILTLESLTSWRNAYVANAGSDPLKRKSAERSSGSILRAGRALFAKDIIVNLDLALPPSPFAGFRIREPGPQRYHSDINPEWLLVCAERELRPTKRDEYLALILCLCAGLRRKEADLLMWSQINFAERILYVKRTKYFEPKTEESQRAIDLNEDVLNVIRSFMPGSTSEFVLNGSDPNPDASYAFYRCDGTWRDLTLWLKGKGITHRTAIHTLRKESGSLIASEYGIEAARQHLGHRDIQTTSAHYVGKKKRIEVGLKTGAVLASASQK